MRGTHDHHRSCFWRLFNWPVLAVLATITCCACSSTTVVQPAECETTGGTSAAVEGGEACKTELGIRLCGGPTCPWLDSTQCPGLGCAPGVDRVTGDEGGAGVCLADVPNHAIEQCWDCADGEVCLDRKTVGLVCVPEEVCRGLWALGFETVCRYADKSSYTNAPLEGPCANCPLPHHTICGGACGGCGPGWVCSGRSAKRPFGVCVQVDGGGDRCRVQVGVGHDCGYYDTCAVFNVPNVDLPAALAYGNCTDIDTCLEMANDLPGGMRCYDRGGNLIH